MDRARIQDLADKLEWGSREEAIKFIEVLAKDALFQNFSSSQDLEFAAWILAQVEPLFAWDMRKEVIWDIPISQLFPELLINYIAWKEWKEQYGRSGVDYSWNAWNLNDLNNSTSVHVTIPVGDLVEQKLGRKKRKKKKNKKRRWKDEASNDPVDVVVEEQEPLETSHTEEVIPSRERTINQPDTKEAIEADLIQHARDRDNATQQREAARTARPNSSQAPLSSNQAIRAENAAEQRWTEIANLIEQHLDNVDTLPNREAIRALMQEERNLWETERQLRQQEQTAITEANSRNIEQQITANEQERATNIPNRTMAQNSRAEPYSEAAEAAIEAEVATHTLEWETDNYREIRRQESLPENQQKLLDSIGAEQQARVLEIQAREQEHLILTREAVDQQIIANRAERDANIQVRDATQRPSYFVNPQLSQAAILAENATFVQEWETETVIQTMEDEPTPENIQLVEAAASREENARFPVEVRQMQETLRNAVQARQAARAARQTARWNRAPRNVGYADQVVEDAYQAEENTIYSENATEQAALAFRQAQTPQTLQDVRQALADEEADRQAEVGARGIEQAQIAQETADTERLTTEIATNQRERQKNARAREAARTERRAAVRTRNESDQAVQDEEATIAAEDITNRTLAVRNGDRNIPNPQPQPAQPQPDRREFQARRNYNRQQRQQQNQPPALANPWTVMTAAQVRQAIQAETTARRTEQAAREREQQARTEESSRRKTWLTWFFTQPPSEKEIEWREYTRQYRNGDLNIPTRVVAFWLGFFAEAYWWTLDGIRWNRRK